MSNKYLKRTLSFGEIKVKLAIIADPEKLFDELIERSVDDPSVTDEQIPYWAELWPSAVILSRFIADNRKLVDGKTVLEIGCGIGLPGIVAAKSGGKVTLTDYLPQALEYAKINWKLNFETTAETAILDWRSPGSFKKADVLIASDIAYETTSFASIFTTMQKLVKANGLILISEPNRKYAKTFFDKMKNKVKNISEETRSLEKDGIDYLISVYKIRL